MRRAGEIQHDIDALVDLTRDNAAQQESLRQVQKLADAKLADCGRRSSSAGSRALRPPCRSSAPTGARRSWMSCGAWSPKWRTASSNCWRSGMPRPKTDADRTIWTIAVWMPIALLVLAVAAVVLMRTVRFGGPAAPPSAPGKKWGGIALHYASAVIIVAVAVVLRMAVGGRPSALCLCLSPFIRQSSWWRASGEAGRGSWPPCSRRWRPITGSSRPMGSSLSTPRTTSWPWGSSPAPVCF